MSGLLQVGEYLLLPAVVPGPGGVLEEGVAVEVAGDVTGTARVSVLPPGPPQAGRLLQDSETRTQHYTPGTPGTELAKSEEDRKDGIFDSLYIIFLSLPQTKIFQLPSDTETGDPGSDHDDMEVRWGSDLRWFTQVENKQ